MGRGFDWIDDKFHVKAPHKRFLQRRIPPGLSYLYCLGGAAFCFYLVLFATGLLLSMYYIPSETEAYDSILHLQREVNLGWFIRSLHKWSATFLILCILAHTLRVFYSKAYRPPRELNWIVGTMALVLSFASGFTGYLLPWDQKAYWATEVGTSMAGTVPVVGPFLLNLVRGGVDVSQATLSRFYSIHVLWLPAAMSVLLWAHFHMIKRQGIKRPL
ncbi:MAG: cytochrome b N-terminal domain-containing protein [Candidatus Magnetobacterium sp. LHC-1]|uniref:Cytochrome b N-terminal domain-containing protein n=1 Tax=Candidatus Magnetobacterium casense TaxID=1455061 RepID=A0ABS6S1N2_9BACT|nr:cytochrome b N-terminal domain-containing protein [Candidatus Magnetobacterium casensis]MBF0606687.1 cytochrome b N-terminal domain-containing protein [Nitrospirota bacterium]MBV6342755.1 cytochrome b N-terminal domain-containing protein [Candidatus Magnetobacterium casensis]